MKINPRMLHLDDGERGFKWRCIINVGVADKVTGIGVGDFMGIGWGNTKRTALAAAVRYMERNVKAARWVIDRERKTSTKG